MNRKAILPSLTLTIAAMVGSLALSGTAQAADPPFISADAPWLTTLNYYRSMAGLKPVTHDPALSVGTAEHSCYMLANDISHDEVVGAPGYTVEGRQAGLNGNVAVANGPSLTSRAFMEVWMTGPFHAIGMLRPQLERVGFGRCDRTDTPKWTSGATLDIIRGLGATVPRTQPILFPGNGTTTSLYRFIAETPSPVALCGWTGEAGLPVIAMLPERVANPITATMTGPDGPIETCTLSEHNTTGHAQALLAADNMIVVVPRTQLKPGAQSVVLGAGTRNIAWTFTVDPEAAFGPAPLPNATALGGQLALQPVTPVRVVDTRDGFGATTLAAGVAQRIQIGGTSKVPPTAVALSANLTVTNASAGGYVTLWNCSAQRPVVATINFKSGQTVANAAVVAIDATGGVCAYANTAVDIVVDINGFFEPAAAGRFSPVAPQRLLDTRTGSPAGSLPAGGTVSLQVTGAAGVPGSARAAVLTVATVDPAADGFVTVWPCDAPRPLAASLNPESGKATSNLVVAPLSGTGTVCFFASTAADLVVDIVGFVSSDSTKRLTPAQPFRFLDTRELGNTQLTAGTEGPVAGGQTIVVQVAGQRGIPAGATAVSANIAVVGASAPGYLTAFPCGARPATSNVNYGAGGATSTAAQIPLSASGQLCIFSQNTADVIVDVSGWWS